MQRNKVLVIVAVVAAVVLLCCCASTVAFLVFRGAGESAGAYRLSEEQQSVVNDLGDPDTFSLVFGEASGEDFDAEGTMPVHRVEHWNYWDSRVRVVFRDGRYIRHEALEPLPDGEWEFPDLKPAEFTQGMTAQQVTDVVGEVPDAAVRAAQDSAVDLTIASFRKQVFATFERDALVGVSTQPAKGGGE